MRAATRADLPRVREIRESVAENSWIELSLIDDTEEVEWYLDHATFLVAENEYGVQGFVCADPQTGYVAALFVIDAARGRGFGKALLEAALERLRAAGNRQSFLVTGAGTRAEGFYTSRDWQAMGADFTGQKVFRRAL